MSRGLVSNCGTSHSPRNAKYLLGTRRGTPGIILVEGDGDAHCDGCSPTLSPANDTQSKNAAVLASLLPTLVYVCCCPAGTTTRERSQPSTTCRHSAPTSRSQLPPNDTRSTRLDRSNSDYFTLSPLPLKMINSCPNLGDGCNSFVIRYTVREQAQRPRSRTPRAFIGSKQCPRFSMKPKIARNFHVFHV